MWLFRKKIPDEAALQSLHAAAGALAVSFGHDYIGVEHLFLSFRTLPPDHPVWVALAAYEIDLAAFFAALEEEGRVPVNRAVPSNLPFTPRLRNILRAAARAARREHAPQVTVPHLLAAILREGGSLPAAMLATAWWQAHPKGSLNK